MDDLLAVIRTRLMPALLTAAGVALVTAGLLSYADPLSSGASAAAPTSSPAEVTPSPAPGSATPAGSATPRPSDRPLPSGGVLPASPSHTAPPADRVVTRIAIPLLQIDLPVIKQPDPSYPSCDVAMYHEAFDAPGLAHGPYMYAHARTGMFLPLLDRSKVNNGKAMLGMLVQVWTSDDRLFLYEISRVKRHVPTALDLTLLWKEGRNVAWLQTSEGPNSSYPKLQIMAKLLSEQAADHADAHPAARPRDC
jgi:hypothetical protein